MRYMCICSLASPYPFTSALDVLVDRVCTLAPAQPTKADLFLPRLACRLLHLKLVVAHLSQGAVGHEPHSLHARLQANDLLLLAVVLRNHSANLVGVCCVQITSILVVKVQRLVRRAVGLSRYRLEHSSARPATQEASKQALKLHCCIVLG